MKKAELVKRIEQRLKDLNRSPITAAVSAGLERTYLRDFINGRKASISTNKMDLVARALDWTVADLTSEAEVKPASASTVASEVIPAPEFDHPDIGPRNVPVLGITVGGGDDGDNRDADFWINGEIVNYVARPRGIAHARNVFSLYVGGDSMYPRYRERDLVYVQKASPASGDDVVIELHPTSDGGSHPSFIKEFVRRRGSFITVRQFNPAKEIDFDVKEIKDIFRVLPLKELMG